MKNEITPKFASTILKLDVHERAKYCARFINIEIHDEITKEMRFINIHQFIHTHCRDYLMSYDNGLKIVEVVEYPNHKRIPVLQFTIYVTVPDLEGSGTEHIETFSGLSELMLYVNAVEWLIKYRKDNINLSKFWKNRF